MTHHSAKCSYDSQPTPTTGDSRGDRDYGDGRARYGERWNADSAGFVEAPMRQDVFCPYCAGVFRTRAHTKECGEHPIELDPGLYEAMCKLSEAYSRWWFESHVMEQNSADDKEDLPIV